MGVVTDYDSEMAFASAGSGFWIWNSPGHGHLTSAEPALGSWTWTDSDPSILTEQSGQNQLLCFHLFVLQVIFLDLLWHEAPVIHQQLPFSGFRKSFA